jgi:hypothetical protein
MSTLWHVRRGSISPAWWVRALVIGAAIAALLSVSVAAVGQSLSVFTAQQDGDIVFGSKALFPGERVTPAFRVGDASSGVEIDRSSPFAFPADGLATTTSPWSSGFATNHYVDFELNDSLASGVSTSGVAFNLAFASSGSGQACFYFEVRRATTDAVLSTVGDPSGPVGCVTGTTLTTFSTPLPSVTSTTIANDMRIRVFGRESAGASSVIDLATVGGTTPYQAFTLYPVMFRDAADSTVENHSWGLAVP